MTHQKKWQLLLGRMDIWLPVILVSCYLILLTSITYKQKLFIEEYVIEDKLADINHDMILLQTNVQEGMNQTEIMEVRASVMNQGTHAEYKNLVVFDHEYVIKFSTKERLVGQAIQQKLSEFDIDYFSAVVKKNEKSLFFNKKNKTVSVYLPLFYDDSTDVVRKKKTWGIFLYADLTQELDTVWYRVLKTTWYFWLASLFIFLFLFFLLRKFVTLPIRALQAQVRSFKQGEQDNLEIISGPNEVAKLSQEFIQMAKEIDEQYLTVKKNEAYLQSLIDNEPECVKTIDCCGALLEMNPAGLKLIEAKSFDEVNKACVYDIIHPDFRDAYIQLNRNVFAGQSETLTYKIVALEGTERWVETHAVPITDDNGNVIKHFAISRDVSVNMEFQNSLKTILAGVSYSQGSSYYSDLVKNISAELKINTVLISKYKPVEKVFSIISMCNQGQLMNDFECSAEDIPCIKVIKQGKTVHETDIKTKYQHVTLIANQKLEDYLGCPLIDSKGNIIGTISIMDTRGFSDIDKLSYILQIFAARSSAEIEKSETVDQLIEIRQNFETVFRENPEPMFLASLEDGKILDMNKSFELSSGYSRDEMLEKTPIELKAIESPKQLITFKNIIKENGSVKNFRITCLTRQRIKKYFEVSAEIISLNNKKVLLSIMRDITEEMQYENSMELISRGLSFDVGDVLLDKLMQNLSALFKADYALLGTLVDEARKVKLNRFYVNGEQVENIEYYLAGTPCENVMKKLECCIYPSDICTSFPADKLLIEIGAESYIGTPLLNSEKKPIGILALIFKREYNNNLFVAERILSIFSGRAAGELEKLAIEDKQKRLQSQLYESQKMDAIGQLTGGIAHDFNNILASVIGYTDLAKTISDNQNEKLHKYLDEIYKGGIRARDLVDQLMSFSRARPDKKKPVDAIKSVNDNIIMLRPMLPSSISISLETDLASTEYIFIDPVQLQQVLMNLIINSRDALERHGVILITISILKKTGECCSSCKKPIDGNYIEISVSDTGPGISKDVAEHIFNAFYTTKDIGKGTGLGLSIVQDIVHSNDGHIILKSNVNEGACFALYFPVHTAQINIEHHVSNSISNSNSNSNSNSITTVNNVNANILIIDDEENIVSFMKELLENEGYSVTGISDSLEARELILEEGFNYDLIISDQTMPHITGMELANILKQQYPNIPFILCTGYSNKLTQKSMTDCGVKELIMKPAEPKKILSVLEKYLSEREDSVSKADTIKPPTEITLNRKFIS